ILGMGRTSDDKLWHLSPMVEKAKAKGRGKKPSGTPRKRRGVKLRPTELGATELMLATLPAELEELAAAVRGDGGAVLATYREPLGGHALMLTALLVPERPVAYQILALNIEKAHNLREKAIGVRRMYVDLAPVSDGDEESYALEFEEPALATLGFAYEERGRLSGGAYHSILRKADRWLSGKLAAAEPKRRARAALLLEYDEAVTAQVAAL